MNGVQWVEVSVQLQSLNTILAEE